MEHKSYKTSKVHLQPRDIKLLDFLFENKGATFKQIQKYIFDSKKVYSRKRLSLLSNANLIRKTYDIRACDQYVYYLNPNIKSDHLKFERSHIDTIFKKRDLVNLEVRSKIINFQNFDGYFTETMIKSKQYDKSLKEITATFKEKTPFSIARFLENGQRYFAGVEYQLNNYWSVNVCDLLAKYKSGEEIRYIFLICDSGIIKSTTSLVERRFNDLAKKVCVITPEELLESDSSIRFQKASGGFVTFDLKPIS